jgi:hypothetical protein
LDPWAVADGVNHRRNPLSRAQTIFDLVRNAPPLTSNGFSIAVTATQGVTANPIAERTQVESAASAKGSQ